MACETVCTFFYVFFTFFQNPKKHDFLRFFELLHTFSRTVHDASEYCACYTLVISRCGELRNLYSYITYMLILVFFSVTLSPDNFVCSVVVGSR